MPNDLTPILIGAGQITDKEPDPGKACSPLDLMEQTSHRALQDAGLTIAALEKLDTLVIVRSFQEAVRNSPQALASRLGAAGARQWLTPNGGNAPQYLVNRYFEDIAKGKAEFVLLSGAEAIATRRKFRKAGVGDPWSEPMAEDPQYLFPDRQMVNEHEIAHGIWMPAHVYPMFENALRGHYGHSIQEHQRSMGALFADFSRVAAASPHAWFPIQRTATEIAEAGPRNRFVGWPYTKYMNAMNQINQGASLLLCSIGFAKRMGVPESRWLYLHGCADANDIWYVSERRDYFSSPAIGVMGEKAFQMAGLTIDEMDFIDLYSCFPSAVQIARDELGIATNDPRPLTITGGLPFHGGAGNNYVMNSIAAMADLLRERPGAFGLITANGGFLTKHSIGIYSTEAPTQRPGHPPWRRANPAVYQAQLDNVRHPSCEPRPMGTGTVETYTLTFGRDGNPQKVILLGRLGNGDPEAPRFIANVPADRALAEQIMTTDILGHSGKISSIGNNNLFAF